MGNSPIYLTGYDELRAEAWKLLLKLSRYKTFRRTNILSGLKIPERGDDRVHQVKPSFQHLGIVRNLWSTMVTFESPEARAIWKIRLGIL